MSAPFPLPAIFTAWGFRHSGDRWSSASDLAAWCVTEKIPTVAVQLGLDEHGCTNTELDDVAALRTAGLRVLVWGVASGSYVRGELERLGAQEKDWLPQIEGPDQRDLVLDAATYGLRPWSIVTTYSGAGAENVADVQKLHDAGVETVLVECYASDQTVSADLERMLWQGTVYGWKESELFATMGVYRGELPATYSGIIGREWALYLAEPMTSEQWEAFGALPAAAPTPEPEPEPPKPNGGKMPPVTDTQARDSVSFAAQAWEQNQTDYTPKARLTVCRRIAQQANVNDAWYSIRDEIVRLLDQAGLPQ